MRVFLPYCLERIKAIFSFSALKVVFKPQFKPFFDCFSAIWQLSTFDELQMNVQDHIVDILVRHNLIKRPKVLTKKRYLEIERILKEIARKSNLNLAEMDLYLWYIETKKNLK